MLSQMSRFPAYLWLNNSPLYRLCWWLNGKESASNAGDVGLIPEWGRSPGEGNGKTTPVFLPGESHG